MSHFDLQYSVENKTIRLTRFGDVLMERQTNNAQAVILGLEQGIDVALRNKTSDEIFDIMSIINEIEGHERSANSI